MISRSLAAGQGREGEMPALTSFAVELQAAGGGGLKTTAHRVSEIVTPVAEFPVHIWSACLCARRWKSFSFPSGTAAVSPPGAEVFLKN